MSQPAVSEAIAGLESTVRVRLLDRGPRGVTPTIYAELLLKRGHTIFDELIQGLRDIEYLTSGGIGDLRVGAPEFIAAGFVSSVIERMARSHPGITVRHVDALTGNLEFQELKARHVDLMLARVTEPGVDADFDIEVLFDEPFHVVASVDSTWAHRRKLSLANLATERWILQPPGNLLRARIDKAFRAQGIEPPREGVASFSVHLRNHLVSTGQYLTVMPASTLRFNAKAWALKALPIDLGLRIPIGIVKLSNRTLSPIVEVFIEHARAVAKTMDDRSARHSG
jgi:DNA-binding transcriptional LysR family regulator